MASSKLCLFLVPFVIFSIVIPSRIHASGNTAPLILRLVSACIPIADHAGNIIRNVLKTGELNIVEKDIEDYQTEADRRAQKFIISSLSYRFPKITVIGEEEIDDCSVDLDFNETDESVLLKECPQDLLDISDDQVTIWVDPLDGTSEYTQGRLQHVNVLIGIAVGTRAVAGVIHQPYYGYKEEKCCGRTIWGLVGLGAYGYTPLELPNDRMILATTLSNSNVMVEEAIDALKPDEVLRIGGFSNKILLVLERRVHAYVYASQRFRRWDTCAPEAVLHAAGGLLTDLSGSHYDYAKETKVENSAGIIATANKEDHSKLLQMLPDYIKFYFKN